MKTGHLSLPIRNDYKAEWLSTPGNATAYEAMQRWCQGQEPAQVALVGPCSKTFLAQMASKISRAPLYNACLGGGKAIIVDDANCIRDSVSFFNWYNEAQAHGMFVLYTASEPPSLWPHTLPDLLSRLRTIPVVRIEPWADEELEMLLPRMMRAQGLEITETNTHFVLQHMERSFKAMQGLVDHAHHFAPHRRITKAFLKDFLNKGERI